MSFADILEAKPKEAELYKVLGCDEKSTKEQITAEYRARVRDYHPDKRNQNSENSEEITQKFMVLQNAYEILTNESDRSAYDQWLHSPFSVNFDDFLKNRQKFQMSTHWAIPKTQYSIASSSSENSEKLKNAENSTNRWSEGDRYQSSVSSAFRNYKL